jgi:hypothetical protein
MSGTQAIERNRITAIESLARLRGGLDRVPLHVVERRDLASLAQHDEATLGPHDLHGDVERLMQHGVEVERRVDQIGRMVQPFRFENCGWVEARLEHGEGGASVRIGGKSGKGAQKSERVADDAPSLLASPLTDPHR